MTSGFDREAVALDQGPISPTETALARRLADWLIERHARPLPPAIRDHARVLLTNAVAVTVGGMSTEAVSAAAAAGRAAARSEAACLIPGIGTATDPWTAAVLLGVAGHVDDYDDTHLETVIHPSTPTLAALLPAIALGATAPFVLRAFALGCEAQLRVGLAMTPSHYDRGWHITGTCGTVGAAVAAALAFGSGPAELARAIELSCCLSVGHRESFGTMTKALHVGKAAQHGLLAYRAADVLDDGPLRLLERPGGFFSAVSDAWDIARMRDGGKVDWRLGDVAVKPYPCGVVSHPLIDAGRALRAAGVMAADIKVLRARCHPLVPELMGIVTPSQELEARFSAFHALAVAVCDPYVGRGSFGADRLSRPDVASVRARVQLVPTADIGRDAAEVEAELNSGERRMVRIDHARGTPKRHLRPHEVLEKGAHLTGGHEGLAVLERLLELDEDCDGADLTALVYDPRLVAS